MKLVEADKGTHFVAGAGITAGALMLLPVTAAGAVCVVAALLREAYGLRRHGRWDWADIAWTVAGGGVVLLGAVAPQALA
jgi:hypothetical protein